MNLHDAIDVVLGANNGERPVAVTEYVEAINVVLDAMRNDITTGEAVKWCLKHKTGRK